MIGIFRHAKADKGPSEMERPLTIEGKKAAMEVAKKLNITWDIVIASPAERAQQTAWILGGKEPNINEILYVNSQPTEEHIIKLVNSLKLSFDKPCLIVTHEPIVHPLVRALGVDGSLPSIATSEGILLDGKTYQYIGK